MNIFAVNSDPVLAAQSLCDKHVVKMVLESSQILSTAHHTNDSKIQHLVYKPTHINHPCTKWARETIDNYIWLGFHALALAKEYTFRYAKQHKCEYLIRLCLSYLPEISGEGLTPFALAMPESCKIAEDPVTCYREYYRKEKVSIARWNKGRDAPDWWD